MTDSNDDRLSQEDEESSRPVASLAEVRVRRRDAVRPDLQPEEAKPGDLTSILEKRRQSEEAGPAIEEAPPPEENDPETIDLSLLEAEQIDDSKAPPSEDKADEAPLADNAAQPTPAATLRDQLVSHRLTREQAREMAGLKEDPPAGSGDNRLADAPPPTAVSIGREGAKDVPEPAATGGETPATVSIRKKPAVPPEPAPITERSMRVSEDAVEPTATDDDATAAFTEEPGNLVSPGESAESAPPAPEPAPTEDEQTPPLATGRSMRQKLARDERAEPPAAELPPSEPEQESTGEEEEAPTPSRGLRRRAKKERQEVEDVLRKRMAAIVRSGSKRREQAAARRNNGDQPAPTKPVAPAAPPRQASAPPGDMFRYWTLHRKGQAPPPLSALNLDEVARNWPDSLLLRFTAATGHLELEMSFSKTAMQGGEGSAPQIDYTPAVIRWVVEQGRSAANDGSPTRATEDFETEAGVRRYSVIALPLSEDGASVDHILCHLQPAR